MTKQMFESLRVVVFNRLVTKRQAHVSKAKAVEAALDAYADDRSSADLRKRFHAAQEAEILAQIELAEAEESFQSYHEVHKA